MTIYSLGHTSVETELSEEKPSAVLDSLFLCFRKMRSQTQKHFLSSNGTSSHTMLFISLSQLPPLLVTLNELFPFSIPYKSASHHSHHIAYLWHSCNPGSQFWISSSLVRADKFCNWSFQTLLSSHHGHSAINAASCYPIKLNSWALPQCPPIPFLFFKWNCSKTSLFTRSKSTL